MMSSRPAPTAGRAASGPSAAPGVRLVPRRRVGTAVLTDHGLFERLTLEAFQSGLSWLTILRKRPAFRAAFAGFDVAASRRSRRDRERLLADAGIVRNRLKVEAASPTRGRPADRRARLAGGVPWGFRPETRGAARARATGRREPESAAIAKELKSAASASSGRPRPTRSCRRRHRQRPRRRLLRAGGSRPSSCGRRRASPDGRHRRPLRQGRMPSRSSSTGAPMRAQVPVDHLLGGRPSRTIALSTWSSRASPVAKARYSTAVCPRSSPSRSAPSASRSRKMACVTPTHLAVPVADGLGELGLGPGVHREGAEDFHHLRAARRRDERRRSGDGAGLRAPLRRRRPAH